MEYFKIITQSDLLKLITSTKNSLFLCLPSIHKEIVDALQFLNYIGPDENPDFKINILLDFDAQTFRQGYGEFEAIEDLLRSDFEIRSFKDNRISFIISDEIGYYLFIESRSLIPADKQTINAVRIDPVSIVRLKRFFFEDSVKLDFGDELTNAIIEETKQLNKVNELLEYQKAPITHLTEDKIQEVKKDLEKNPPLKPDFKRLVEYYSSKFQYAKLKFEGSNISHKKIEIPSRALPILDADLKDKLETKLNLFDINDSKNNFPELLKLKEAVAAIREKYLTKVKSREESLLVKTNKTDFLKDMKTLQDTLKDTKIKVVAEISKQIQHTKQQLGKDLEQFLKNNPIALLPEHSQLLENNEEYMNIEAKSKSDEIIHRIKWPKAHELVSEFNLDIQFSDITIEDLKSDDFVNEIMESGLIDFKDVNQLAKFGLGIKAD